MISDTRGESGGVDCAHPRRILRQFSQSGETDRWGDEPVSHEDLRVGFINIQTFPRSLIHDKNNNLLKLIRDYSLSCIGLAEMNIYWPSVPVQQQMGERIHKWFDVGASAIAYNKYNTKVPRQPGGTAFIATGELVHRKRAKGITWDPLGRWVVMSFHGRNGMCLHVVTAYRPQKKDEPYSPYQQQLEYYQSKAIHQDPLARFDTELCTMITGFLEARDQVVVMLDANECLHKNRPKSLSRKLAATGLREALFSRHAPIQPPATCFPGKSTLDGIFCTESLEVIASGYSGSLGISDHRLAWIDIRWESAFGTYQKICPPPARRLQTDKPEIVQKYVDEVQQILASKEVIMRIKRFQSTVHIPMKTNEIDEYEAIDDILLQCMLCAERRCRKLYMGGVPFSPELKQHLNLINFWRLVLRKKRGSGSNMRTLIRLQKSLGIHGNPLQEDLRTIIANKRLAIKAYHKFKVGAASARTTFLDQRIEELALKGNLEASTIRKHLMQREKTRLMHRRIKVTLGKVHGAGVSRTIVQGLTGTNIIYTKKEDVERENLRYMKTLYTVADHCPLRQEPLLGFFGYTGATPSGDAVTNGLYICPPGIDKYTKLFLEHAKRPDNVPNNSMTMEVNIQQFLKRWTTCKEKTSSSTSGRHFGHYRVIHELCSNVQEGLRVMATLPFLVGYTPRRWCKAVDKLLLKKESDHRVHRTRPIPLLEADYNDGAKRLAQGAAAVARNYDLIAGEQYGSVQYKTASYLCLNKRLIYDISRQRKTPLAVCSNDARSCYDRIVHVAAFLALRRLGVPTQALLTLLETVQRMSHSIRTVFGDSSDEYGGEEWVVPPHGTIQGSGASPLVWAAVSTILFEVLRSEGYGGTFTSPITRDIVTLCGFAFVDDADIVQTSGSSGETIEDIVEELQSAIDTWQGTLRTTGGELDCDDPNKSYWYAIDYTWNKGKWSYVKEYEDINLTILDDEDKRRMVHRSAVDDAHRTLGVMLAPDGGEKAQFDRMLTVANEFADKIRVGYIRGNDALQALRTTVMRTLIYPLACTCLSWKQCRTIMTPILYSILPRLKVVRTVKRDVLYGPKRFQGLGFQNLYTIQGGTHLSYLIQFYNTKTDTGRFLQNTLESMTLELGMSGNIFSQSYSSLHTLVTDCWMKHLWEFTEKNNITIEYDTDLLKPQRVGDQSIMDICAKTHLQVATLQAVNRCRLYLRVVMLSDIVTGDGLSVRWDVYYGKRVDQFPHRYVWPLQGYPSDDDWLQWRNVIQCVFVGAGNMSLSPQLRLTFWDKSLSTKWWPWWYDDDEDIIYTDLFQEGELSKFSPQNRESRQRYRRYCYDGGAHVNLRTLLRCTVRTDRDTSVLFYTGSYEHTNIEKPIPDDPIGFIHHQCTHDEWITNKLTVVGDLTDIRQSLMDGQLVAVSDGSYKTGYGTAAWCIVGRGSILRGVVEVPVGSKELDATRAELAGIYVIVRLVGLMTRYWDINNGVVVIGCDSDSALNSTLLREKVLPYNITGGAHLDFINSLNNMISQSTTQYIGKRIKGHQDDITPFEELDWWAQRNIEMDMLAKGYLSLLMMLKQPNNLVSHLYKEGCSIVVQGTKITGHVINSVHEVIQGNKLKNYWIKLGRMDRENWDVIDWEMMKAAHDVLPFERSIWLTKQVSGFCGTGERMCEWQKRDTAQCPLCTAPEDNLHVLNCPSEIATHHWSTSLDELRFALLGLNTPEETIVGIECHLEQWRNGKSITVENENYSASLRQVLLQQNEIGWQSLLEGCVAQLWQYHAQSFLPSKSNPRKWVQAFIHSLWQVLWNMWDKRCHELHKNDLSNKLHDMSAVDTRIRELLRWEATQLMPFCRGLFQQKEEHIYHRTPKYRREWLHKAEIIYSGFHTRMEDPVTFAVEREVMESWLGSTPRLATAVGPDTDRCQGKGKRQRSITSYFS